MQSQQSKASRAVALTVRLVACPTAAEVEAAPNKRQLCGGSQAAIERMIHFGRELQSMSEHLRRECGKNSTNKKMLKVKHTSRGVRGGNGVLPADGALLLQDAFSLLAYSDPWNSPVGYQLDAIQREPVCSTLNSAILGGSCSRSSAPHPLTPRTAFMSDFQGAALKEA